MDRVAARRRLLLFCLTALACADEPREGLTEAEVEHLRATTEQWASAAMTGDLDALLALYTVDAVVMPPNEPAVQGRDAIREWFESESGPWVESIQLDILEVDGHEELAFVRGRYVMTAAPAAGAPAVTDTGKYLEVRHRMVDGSWLITVDMFSSDRPATGGPPASAR